MATKKILYFQAGYAPTAAELTDIAELNAMAVPAYDVQVRNAAIVHPEEPSDLVAGTIPTAYEDHLAFGDVNAAKPVLLYIAPGVAAISGTGTLQLRTVAVTGLLNALVGSDVTGSAAGTTYASSVVGKATVSAEGLVTGVSAGTTVITATHTYASGKTVTATRTITVS
jgi:hypothetical protein